MAPVSRNSRNETAVIIGGGVIGIACAHYLNEAGYQVTIIEKGAMAGACSEGNCGFICPSHILPLATPDAIRNAAFSLFNPSAPFRVKFRFNSAFLSWMWQFLRRCNSRKMIESAEYLKPILDSSFAEYQTLLDDPDMACQWQSSGLLYVLESASGMRSFAKTDAVLADQFGVGARRIEGVDLAEYDPALRNGLAGAFHYLGDGHLRPDQLNRAWIERLSSHGVKFVENCSFQSLDADRGAVARLHTSKGPIKADHYILAAGALSAELASHFCTNLPIEPGKGYSVTMAQPDGGPKYPMLMPEHHIGVTPFEDGLRLGSMMEFVGFDRSIPDARLQQLRNSAKPYLRTSLPVRNQAAWCGWRPMTPDSLPIIGRAKGWNNVVFATGHNMLGMTLAPATGKLVAELIGGMTPHIDPQPFAPTRFH